MGHAIAHGADLFRWAWRQERVAKSKKPKRNGFAAALAVIVEHGRRELCNSSPHKAELQESAPTPEPIPQDERATCPRCGREGSVHADFGLRRVGGKLRVQSWCRACRSERADRADRAGDDAKTRALDDLPLWSNAH
jgi:hypothetical protein